MNLSALAYYLSRNPYLYNDKKIIEMIVSKSIVNKTKCLDFNRICCKRPFFNLMMELLQVQFHQIEIITIKPDLVDLADLPLRSLFSFLKSKECKIKHITLESILWDEPSIDRLIEALQENQSLTSIKLTINDYRRNGVRVFCELPQKCKNKLNAQKFNKVILIERIVGPPPSQIK